MTPLSHTLITGASGFVPRTIVNTLLQQGSRVTAIDRAFDADLAASWNAYGEQIMLIEGDAAALPDIAVDTVVHGAALTTLPEESGLTPEAHLEANLLPTLRLLEWAHEHGACRTVVMSSSGIYAHSAPGALSEDQPPIPVGTYAIAKAATEAFAQTLKTAYGRDVVCIRLSSIYGDGEIVRPSRPRISLVGRYVHQALHVGRIDIYRPDEARDWTYSGDVGQVVGYLLHDQPLTYALYNVASEEVLTNYQIAEAVASVLPGVELVTHAEPEIGVPPLTRFGYLSHQRLMPAISGHTWVPFHSGIRRVIAAAQQRMKLGMETNL